jgi:hypothetical protein
LQDLGVDDIKMYLKEIKQYGGAGSSVSGQASVGASVKMATNCQAEQKARNFLPT